jgi:hypothetical protein
MTLEALIMEVLDYMKIYNKFAKINFSIKFVHAVVNHDRGVVLRIAQIFRNAI